MSDFFFSSPLHPPSPHDPAWIHIECDCIHQHLLPGSALLVWLRLFNLLKCTLTFFFFSFFPSVTLRIWDRPWAPGSDSRRQGHTHILLSYWCPQLWVYWAVFSFSRIFALASLYCKRFMSYLCIKLPGTKWKNNLTEHKARLASNPRCSQSYLVHVDGCNTQPCHYSNMHAQMQICSIAHLKWKWEMEFRTV